MLCSHKELIYFRCVLAASSPYFQATFSNEFQEAINAHVTLHDISPWVMKKILDYIYTGTLEINLDMALDYLKTGHMLQYPAIVEACCELLSQHLHPSNCLGVKELASLYQCKELESAAYSYVLEHFTSVIDKSEELAELSLDSLVKYLSADNIDISSEVILWKAIREWVCFDIESRRRCLYDLLLCMRLKQLSPKELKVVASDSLVREEPKCAELVESVGCKQGERLLISQSESLHLSDDKFSSSENMKLQACQVSCTSSVSYVTRLS